MDKKSEDRLEKYIISHRSEFDSVDPPEGVWDEISGSLKESSGRLKRLSTFDWMWRVAAVLFFGLSLYLLFDKVTQSDAPDYATTLTEQTYQEFVKAEDYYTGIIKIKKQELNKVLENEVLEKGDPLNSDFHKDIAELDSMYLLLKQDFEKNNDELVMDAMINNLRLRIEILDKQLKIIDNLNKARENKDEGVTT